jgi:hypothetical protein
MSAVKTILHSLAASARRLFFSPFVPPADLDGMMPQRIAELRCSKLLHGAPPGSIELT